MTVLLASVYDALFSLVSGAAEDAAAAMGLRLSVTRRLRHWSNVSPPEMPILMMSTKDIEVTVPRRGAPSLSTAYADFLVYVHVSDQKKAPSIILLPLVDAIREAMKPLPPPPAGTGMNNLGLPDQVEHAAIEGKIETDEGLLGDLSIAMIPIKILCKPSY